MSGKKHRVKGDRVEREIVELHEDMEVHAERRPLSGASNFRGSSHDLDIYADDNLPPMVAEVKARKDGKGFTTIENWIKGYDLLFLKSNRKPPLVVMPWHVYEWFMGVEDSWQPGSKKTQPEETSAKPATPRPRAKDARQIDLEDLIKEADNAG